MVRRRGERRGGVVRHLLVGDGLLAGVLAVVIAVFGLWLMPMWLDHRLVSAHGLATFKHVVWALFGAFSLIAVIRFRLARRTKWLRVDDREMLIEFEQRAKKYAARDVARDTGCDSALDPKRNSERSAAKNSALDGVSDTGLQATISPPPTQ